MVRPVEVRVSVVIESGCVTRTALMAKWTSLTWLAEAFSLRGSRKACSTR